MNEKKICRKHSVEYVFACEMCQKGAAPVVPKLGPEFPLLPRAFDTHKDGVKWIEEWLPKEAMASAYRIKHALGTLSWVMLLDEEAAKIYVLCGFRELYFRELKKEPEEAPKTEGESVRG